LQPELTHRQRSVQQQKNDKSQSFILFLGFIRCMSNKLPKPPPPPFQNGKRRRPLLRELKISLGSLSIFLGELKYFFGGA
jgi:hypothetical protein